MPTSKRLEVLVHSSSHAGMAAFQFSAVKRLPSGKVVSYPFSQCVVQRYRTNTGAGMMIIDYLLTNTEYYY